MINLRKRKYIFIRSNEDIYCISFTNAMIKAIVTQKKSIKESNLNIEAFVFDIDLDPGITIKIVKEKYKSWISSLFPNDINSSIYINIPKDLCVKNSSTKHYLTKFIIWRGQTQAITRSLDVPAEIQIYPISTYHIVRLPIEEYCYDKLISDDEPINFQIG